MIIKEKLEKKLSQISNYMRNGIGFVEDHQAELCSIAIEILIDLEDKQEDVLPFSFDKFGSNLEKYIDSDLNIFDDVSYLICATFIKEYCLYKKYINSDHNVDNIYRTWHEFLGLEIPISNKDNFFNSNYYNSLKMDDTYLDVFIVI